VAHSCKWWQADRISAAFQAAPALSSTDELLKNASDRLPTREWAGRDVVFMRSNDHSRERHGEWNTDGLHGAVKQIVQGDSKAPK
jgi:hypothetical protein